MLDHFTLLAKRSWRSHRFGSTSRERVAAWRTLAALDAAMRHEKIGEEVTVAILGHPMRGFSPRTLAYLFNEVFLADEYRFPSDTPDPLIVDCGANIGFSVLYFKRLFPAARIHAFEANPHAVRLLRENIRKNGLTGVDTRWEALADKEGELSFFIGDDPGTLLGSVRQDRGGMNETRVPAVRLSTTLAALPRVDLVKIDVEGAEWPILDDLVRSDTLAKPARYIIEYHHQIAGEAPRFSAFLTPFERCGFRYHLRAGIRDPRQFQDVLVHLVRG
jgi:FkbM family methyltransferase